VLGPAPCTRIVSPFLEEGVPVAIPKGCRAHIPDQLVPVRVSLAHSEGEVHVAVLFFCAGCGTRRLREGQVANLELLSVVQAVDWVATVDYGPDLEVKLEMDRALEPGVA
jgi:hypothetical protein